MKSEQHGLRLVEPDAPLVASLSGSRWPIDLCSSPFRPGELPERLGVDLGRPITGEAVRKAGQGGVPVALWVRVAVEVGRARVVLSAATARAPTEIDDALVAASDRDIRPAGLSALARYAAAILNGGANDAPEIGPTLELLIPSEMALAWRHSAAESAQSLDSWITQMIAAARPGVEKFEACAASAGEGLAAWCYAAFVAWSASCSASDQPRT